MKKYLKMQEEFEAWCASIGFTLKPNAFDNGDYAMGYGWEEWNAWKASRAALCIKLPENCKGMALTVSELHQQLDKAGVRHE